MRKLILLTLLFCAPAYSLELAQPTLCSAVGKYFATPAACPAGVTLTLTETNQTSAVFDVEIEGDSSTGTAYVCLDSTNPDADADGVVDADWATSCVAGTLDARQTSAFVGAATNEVTVLGISADTAYYPGVVFVPTSGSYQNRGQANPALDQLTTPSSGMGGNIGGTLQLAADAENNYGSYGLTPQRSDPGPGTVYQSGGNTGDTPISTSSQAYNGTYSYEFHVGDSGSEHRSELTTNCCGRNDSEATWDGREIFLAYAIRIPASYPEGDASAAYSTVFGNQFHCDTDNANCSSPVWALLARASDGMIGVRQEFGSAPNISDFTLTTGHTTQSLADTWVRIVWQVKFATDSTGVIRLWINDTLEYEVTGTRTIEAGAGDFGYYKFGLYPSWHDDPGLTTEQPKTVWIDDIRLCTVGIDGCGYETVNPANY